MKITIDTKEDSAADIRKVIALLSKMIEGSSQQSANIFEDSTPILGATTEPDTEPDQPTGANAFANMFGGESERITTPDESSDEPTSSEESDEEAHSIIEY